jgi:hypothetical protein
MAAALSISQIKEQLSKLGLSTSTPGLTGEDRQEELKSRLDNFNEIRRGVPGGGNEDGSSGKADGSAGDNSNAVPALNTNHLSIGELRSRLTMLGVSTTTPGLAGEERRNELLQRLIHSV